MADPARCPGPSYRDLLKADSRPVPAQLLEQSGEDLGSAPLDAARSQVTWSFDHDVKYGPLGWLLGQTMMKAMMGKVPDANLKGLSERVRSNAAAAA